MGIVQKLTARRKAATTGASDARGALSELRAMGQRLRGERAAIEAAPVPLSEAQDAAAVAVLGQAERVLDDLDLASLIKPADGRQPSLILTDAQRTSLAVAANAETVAALVCAELERRYRELRLDGISDDARAAALTRIDADLLAAEMAEEATVRALEADGLAPLRRGDADPRALLACDTELR